jgi:hypothetical protein
MFIIEPLLVSAYVILSDYTLNYLGFGFEAVSVPSASWLCAIFQVDIIIPQQFNHY